MFTFELVLILIGLIVAILELSGIIHQGIPIRYRAGFAGIAILALIAYFFIRVGSGDYPPPVTHSATETSTAFTPHPTQPEISILTSSPASQTSQPGSPSFIAPSELPYTANFDDGDLHGWAFEGEGNTLIQNSELRISSEKTKTAYIGEEYWNDYSISVNVTNTELRENSSYGIVIRKHDSCVHYYLRLTSQSTTVTGVELLKYSPDCQSSTPLVRSQPIHINLDLSNVQTVYIKIINDNGTVVITVWINGQYILKETDSDDYIYSGGIGLRVENATIHFDNLNVEAIRK